MLNKLLMALGMLIYRAGLSPLFIARGKNNPKVLLFHNVAAEENAFVKGLGTTLDPDVFAAHLDYLAAHYEVLPIDALLDRPGGQSKGRPRVAIAFDDGYRSVAGNAWPILQRRNMTAIVYLITRAVGNRALVWVDELNWLLGQTGEPGLALGRDAYGLPADADAADVVSAARVQFDRARLAALIAALAERVPSSPVDVLRSEPLYMSWDEVRAMVREGASFGNHTATHPNMGRLGEDEQRAEIVEAQQALAANGVDTVHFAYPFGHHNNATPRIAQEAGLEWMAEVGGSNRGGAQRGIGRVDIRATTTAELFAQMEIVEPVKSLLRSMMRRPAVGWEPAPAVR